MFPLNPVAELDNSSYDSDSSSSSNDELDDDSDDDPPPEAKHDARQEPIADVTVDMVADTNIIPENGDETLLDPQIDTHIPRRQEARDATPIPMVDGPAENLQERQDLGRAERLVKRTFKKSLMQDPVRGIGMYVEALEHVPPSG